MESFVRSTIALRAARRAGKAVTPQCHTTSPPSGPIVIEVTTTEGKTASRETIVPVVAEPSPASRLSLLVDDYTYHIHTIALFTYSDAKTVLLPSTLFGIAHALSAQTLGLNILSPTTTEILTRLPLVMVWIYLNLIHIAIGNQNRAAAVLEDSIRRPWRPLPSQRITPSQATNLQHAARVIALLFSLRHGGVSQFMVLTLLGLARDDTGLGDSSIIARNSLNGLAFISFGSGAMEVALGRGFRYLSTLTVWLRLVAVVVAMGSHAADLCGRENDRVASTTRRRITLPVVIGDGAARWCLALPVLGSSFLCPCYWDLGGFGYVLPVVCGVVVAGRTLTKRNVIDDRTTYKLWHLWLAAVCCLPSVKDLCTVVA